MIRKVFVSVLMFIFLLLLPGTGKAQKQGWPLSGNYYVTYADTALMLRNYIRSSALSDKVSYPYLSMQLSYYLQKNEANSLYQKYLEALKYELGSRVSFADTANMFTGYLRKSDAALLLNPFLKIADASGIYATISQNNLKLDKKDTSLMLSKYIRKSNLSTVATTGSYTDLKNQPFIPSVPTVISAFVNDKGYVTSTDMSKYLPYSGAGSDLDMGAKSIRVGSGQWFANGGLGGYDLSIGTETNQYKATNGSALNISAKLYPSIVFWKEGHIPAGSIASTPSGRGAIATLAVTGDLSASEDNKYDLGGTAPGLYRWRNVYANAGDFSGNISATSFVKQGGIASQILTADGSVLSAGKNIRISDGLIDVAGMGKVAFTADYNDLINKPNLTVFVQNDRLIHYLPVAGGSLTGLLKGTAASFSEGIVTKKITVTQEGWSDFVFNKEYRLRSLQDVETYIKTHHHLPDVPSAQEVEEKGISIGDNQALLLQKIEELTLYLLEQNKKITTLEQDIRKLKKK